MKSACRLILLLGCSLALAACGGPAGPATYDVSGTVTLDGAPLSEGQIAFRAADGQGQSYGGKIENGAYAFECAPGKKKVSITASREVPGKFDEQNPGEKVPLIEQYIPAQYNEETTLEAEVTKSEGNFDFELKSE